MCHDQIDDNVIIEASTLVGDALYIVLLHYYYHVLIIRIKVLAGVVADDGVAPLVASASGAEASVFFGEPFLGGMWLLRKYGH